jgi:hypothetical protein
MKTMKPLLLLILLVCASSALQVQAYKHKSEADIARMTPAQRVDEYIKEFAHRFDLYDLNSDTIEKYILQDGLKVLPRIIEIMDQYDPTKWSGRTHGKGERFEACWVMFNRIDRKGQRLRASPEGRLAIAALERALNRMTAAGYDKEDQRERAQHGRFELVKQYIKEARGINQTDEVLQNTFRVIFHIAISDLEFHDFIEFLVSRHPDYPSWSNARFVPDPTRPPRDGRAMEAKVLEKPERFREAYTEFKRQ